MARCHVLQVTQDLGHGGLERVAATIGRHLDPNRFQVSFLALREGGPRAEELVKEGFRVDVLDSKPDGADYLSTVKVARYVRSLRPDVIHTHNTQALIDGTVGALLSGRPPLVHTDHARQFPDQKRYMIAEHILSRLAYRIVGVSEHTTRNLRRYERIPWRKLMTIPNGVDIPRLDRHAVGRAVRSELGLRQDDLIIGAAVRLTPQKCLDLLIEAFAGVHHRFDHANLVIAGTGPDREALGAHADRLGVRHRVHFLGLRHDVPRLLCAYDVFALSSVWEGMPLGVLEAMALGCPVVATQVGGVSEMIKDGHSGIIVKPRDVSALESALAALLVDPVLGQAMAARAREHYHQQFGLQRMINSYQTVYLRAAGMEHNLAASPPVGQAAEALHKPSNESHDVTIEKSVSTRMRNG
jgi:glycosyltransferase involved in cell wall biosynthesis